MSRITDETIELNEQNTDRIREVMKNEFLNHHQTVNRRKVQLFLVLALWNLAIGIVLYLSRCRLEPPNSIGNGVRWKRKPQNSSERTNIFFLKTHKCGSSTLQNILLRFGHARQLDFVLPAKGNYLGWKAFNRRYIAEQLMEPHQTFNILTHHIRYNYKEVKTVMKPDAAFVTVLRQPSSVFSSIYGYYGFDKRTNISLKELIRSPEHWSKVNRDRFFEHYRTNQMSFDLGFHENKTHDPNAVGEFIQKIEQEFDLVMITEHMEASLVLLCDLMNWPLEHVVHLDINKRDPKLVVKLDPSEQQVLLAMNRADDHLYSYFYKKFRSLVRDYGLEKMKNQVKKLLELNLDLKRRCIHGYNYRGYRNTIYYFLKDPPDWLCNYATTDELIYTNVIRELQLSRVRVLRRLEALAAL